MDRRTFLTRAAVGGALLTVAPGALAARGRPVALVTADAEAHVAAIDPRNGRLLRRIRTREFPHSIEAVTDRLALVAHSDAGRLTLIDSVRLRGRPVRGALGAPRYTAAHPDGRFAYVTDSERGEVVVLDLSRGRIVRRIDVGGPARHLGIDPLGRRLWVALGSRAEEIVTLDVRRPARPQIVRRFRPPFRAHDVVFAPGGRNVWITSGDQRRVLIYNASTGRIIRRIAAGAPPQHIAFGTRVAYVTSGDDGTLRAHRLDGRLLRETPVPVGSYNISSDHGLIVCPSLTTGTLAVLNRHARSLRRPRVAIAAHDACLMAGR